MTIGIYVNINGQNWKKRTNAKIKSGPYKWTQIFFQLYDNSHKAFATIGQCGVE